MNDCSVRVLKPSWMKEVNSFQIMARNAAKAQMRAAELEAAVLAAKEFEMSLNETFVAAGDELIDAGEAEQEEKLNRALQAEKALLDAQVIQCKTQTRKSCRLVRGIADKIKCVRFWVGACGEG